MLITLPERLAWNGYYVIYLHESEQEQERKSERCLGQRKVSDRAVQIDCFTRIQRPEIGSIKCIKNKMREVAKRESDAERWG